MRTRGRSSGVVYAGAQVEEAVMLLRAGHLAVYLVTSNNNNKMGQHNYHNDSWLVAWQLAACRMQSHLNPCS